jgi:methionine biosynthesis protein MetW
VVSLVELNSPYGHDAFLLEVKHLGDVMEAFLNGSSDSPYGGASTTCGKIGRMQEFDIIEQFVAPKANVLDLGCGDGRLIHALWQSKKVNGFGVDRDFCCMVACLQKNVPIMHMDLNQGLQMLGSGRFDYAVLSRTMEEMQKPAEILQEIVRVAKIGIISFPNAGFWQHRLRMLWSGQFYKSSDVWYEGAAKRLFSLHDFLKLCSALNIVVLKQETVSSGWFGRLLCKWNLPNAGAERIVLSVCKK